VEKESLVSEIKELIMDTLNLEEEDLNDLSSDEPFLKKEMDIDSIDLLELSVAIEKKYKIKIGSSDRAEKVFYSLNSIADFILDNSARA